MLEDKLSPGTKPGFLKSEKMLLGDKLSPGTKPGFKHFLRLEKAWLGARRKLISKHKY